MDAHSLVTWWLVLLLGAATYFRWYARVLEMADLEACAASDEGKQASAHDVSISRASAPSLLVSEEEFILDLKGAAPQSTHSFSGIEQSIWWYYMV